MFSYRQFYFRIFYCDLLKMYYDENGKVAVAFISFILSISIPQIFPLNLMRQFVCNLITGSWIEKGDIVNLLIIDEKKELLI